MILGTGIDIVEINRMVKYLERFGERGRNRLFTAAEQQYCESKPRPALHYAARFAAKEAFAKARKTGVGESLSWLDVWVEKAESGAPLLILSQEKRDESHRFHLSLSHTDQYAVATVTIEKIL